VIGVSVDLFCDLISKNKRSFSRIVPPCSLCFTHGLGCLTFRSAAITGAGSGLGRDIAFGLAAKDSRVFSTAVSSDENLDFKHASGVAITLSRFAMGFEV
jgi:hypothetical protein